MTLPELNAIKALTKAVEGLTKEVRAHRLGDAITYADNMPFPTPSAEKLVTDDKTLNFVRDIMIDHGADKGVYESILKTFEDQGIVFVNTKS